MEPRVSVTQMESQIANEIGAKLAGILKSNTPSRICGLLTARGRSQEWEQALEHIRDHFHPMPEKPSHAVFCRRLRDPDVLKDFIKRAAAAPSTLRLSKLTLPARGQIGAPCLLIIRNFGHQIGMDSDQTCLVIVADFQGNLVTAYPMTKKAAGAI